MKDVKKIDFSIWSKELLVLLLLALYGLFPATNQVGAESVPGSFADLADELGPTVVNVYSSQVIKSKNLPYNYFFNEQELPDLFRYFFDNPRRQGQRRLPPQKRTSLGSGVIISNDGYIVTNNHVVEDADKINIKLANSEEYDAVIIGRYAQTDLALIKSILNTS